MKENAKILNRRNYKRIFKTLHRRLLEDALIKILSTNNQSPFKRVLAAGSGTDPYRLIIQCDEYLAIDINGLFFPDVIADINDLPFSECTFDLVLATEVLEHIQNPYTAISEIYRVISPNGQLILTTPFLFHIHGSPQDYFRYTSDGLKTLLSQFDKVFVRPLGNRFSTTLDLISLGRFRLLRALMLIWPLIFRWIKPDHVAPSGYITRAWK